MARYDRIAPLTAPTRARAFPAWLTLRDLEGRERDVELGRRARLRFLAIRPVRRLLRRGIDRVPLDSYERQIEGVREELGHLSARDPERARLAEYLHRIRQRTPAALAAAALELGEVAEASGHTHAAEEYYLTSLELAEAYDLRADRTRALRHLGRVYGVQDRWQESESHFRRSAELAQQAGDRTQWAQAMHGLAALHRRRGDPSQGRRILEETFERGRQWDEPTVVAAAAAGLVVAELELGNPERALEHGWTAVRLLPDPEERARVLHEVGVALTRLGLYVAAERCFALVAERAADGALRLRAKGQHALVPACAGDADVFRERRRRVLQAAADMRPDAAALADLHLELGRGCLVVGDVDFARDHLRDAIGLARRERRGEVLPKAEELLTTLERVAGGGAVSRPRPVPAGAVAQRIAAEIESLGEVLVPASS
ncbi:MAG: tetratricopeptide repeat protein [Gemmatimonadetes bacterium]|nr:tetratricopeptide repeat protein [Gemmatimonadota bacterium]